MKSHLPAFRRNVYGRVTVRCMSCGADLGEHATLARAERAFDAHQAARKQAAEVAT